MNIIRLANDSGLTYYSMGKDRARFIHHLEAFAALVEAAARADEREECADIAENWNSNGSPRVGVAAQIRARGTT
jgi:hypothetical protein